jgi:hypothetical protein
MAQNQMAGAQDGVGESAGFGGNSMGLFPPGKLLHKYAQLYPTDGPPSLCEPGYGTSDDNVSECQLPSLMTRLTSHDNNDDNDNYNKDNAINNSDQYGHGLPAPAPHAHNSKQVLFQHQWGG